MRARELVMGTPPEDEEGPERALRALVRFFAAGRLAYRDREERTGFDVEGRARRARNVREGLHVALA